MAFLRALLAALGLASPAASCEVALALAVDVSGSVNIYDYRIQVDGLAEALRDGQVAEALVRGEAAVMLVQWSGTSRQAVGLDWTRIGSFEDVEAFAAAIGEMPREWTIFSTAIGEALAFTADRFDAVTDCERKVIDVSGDGVSNEGTPPGKVRDGVLARGLTINALVIEDTEPGVTEHYRDEVIGGPGAFVMTANTFREYPEGIRRKLRRELAEVLALAE